MLARAREYSQPNETLDWTRNLFNIPIDVSGHDANQDGRITRADHDGNDSHFMVNSKAYQQPKSVTELMADLNEIVRAELPDEYAHLAPQFESLVNAHNQTGYSLVERREALKSLQRGVIEHFLDSLGENAPTLDLTHRETRYALILYSQSLEKSFRIDNHSVHTSTTEDNSWRFWLQSLALVSPILISNIIALGSQTPVLSLAGHMTGTVYGLASGYWSTPQDSNNYLRLLRAKSLLNTRRETVDEVINLARQSQYHLGQAQVLPLLAQMSHLSEYDEIGNKAVTITPFGKDSIGRKTKITNLLPNIEIEATYTKDLEPSGQMVNLVDTEGSVIKLKPEQYRMLLANAQLVKNENGHYTVLVAGLADKKWMVQCLEIADYVKKASQLSPDGYYTDNDYTPDAFHTVRSELGIRLMQDYWRRIAAEHSGAMPPHRNKYLRNTIILNAFARGFIQIATTTSAERLAAYPVVFLFDLITILAAYNILGDGKATKIRIAGEQINQVARRKR